MRCRICREEISPDEIKDMEAHVLTGILDAGFPEAQANRGAVHQRCLNRCRMMYETFDASFMYALDLVEESIRKYREKVAKVG